MFPTAQCKKDKLYEFKFLSVSKGSINCMDISAVNLREFVDDVILTFNCTHNRHCNGLTQQTTKNNGNCCWENPSGFRSV